MRSGAEGQAGVKASGGRLTFLWNLVKDWTM